jgi:hypothetical protein
MHRAAILLLLLVSASAAYADEGCPTTRPSLPAFAPPPRYSPAPLGADTFLVGTSDLWVAVPSSPWRGLRQKLFWWRPDYDGAHEQRPNLTLTIRPIASRVTSSVDRAATNARFGGEWSMLTMVDFPAPGCWEILGLYEGHSVAFVASVEPETRL